MLTNIFQGGFGLIQQQYAGRGYFTQVMRRHIGGHTHGNPCGAIE